MIYYKVYRDKSFSNFISIDETELEKAMVAFRFNTPAIFKEGALEKVGDILPDYNKSMGWNPTHTLDNDDWNEIRYTGTGKNIKELSEKTKEKIDYLIETKQEHLLGKNIDIKIPHPENLKIDNLVNQLSIDTNN